jgi:hypothetical protein
MDRLYARAIEGHDLVADPESGEIEQRIVVPMRGSRFRFSPAVLFASNASTKVRSPA